MLVGFTLQAMLYLSLTFYILVAISLVIDFTTLTVINRLRFFIDRQLLPHKHSHLEYKLKGSHLSLMSFLTSSFHYWQGKGTPF